MSKVLSDVFVKKAKKELREDESRKLQSYKIVKEWVLKHPFITVLDPEILTLEMFLPFLRVKKFSMDKVYESIEKTLLFIKRHKNWSDFHGEKLQRALDLYDTGYLIVTREHDSECRKIIVCNHEMNLTKFNADDVFRLIVLLFSTLYNDEEAQIGGVIYISDARAANINYITSFTIKSFFQFVTQLKSSPIRMKKIVTVGMPAFANQLMNISKLALSEKIKNRLKFVDGISELSNQVDVSILTEEYGGKYTKAELVEDFRPKLVANAKFMSEIIEKIQIDFSKVVDKEYDESEMRGSFRKLEID
ncbi:alpha-tocopherol transfer protein-like [Chironomus tepperi]|uniref:alpha-tocopherol transfer protein-like n=1 Tax=Chironomus tepperi TaxID=113505 RepID=UPI00391F8BA5